MIAFSFITIWFLFDAPHIYSVLFRYHQEQNFRSIYFLFFFIGYSCSLFFVIPALISQFIYQEKLKELGLIMPHNKTKAIILMIVAELILIPAILFIGKQQSVQTYYSFINNSSTALISAQFVGYIFYYFCEEFFFRGFLFLRLWRKIGWHAFWIVDILFVFCHLFKPLWEIALFLHSLL
jgi:membrane protease YdiL (CAAX protease family)